MQVIITQKYKCEKCGTVYNSEQEALACEAKGFTIPEWVKEGQVVKSLLHPKGVELTGEYRLYPTLAGREHTVKVGIFTENMNAKREITVVKRFCSHEQFFL
jgi:hypothetical protein